ncbi:hypothetical protein VNI00_018994 [Paramarasmius palmivorus]|uniref:Uncharacterized protein n=1 Tax=Paramarasmius palmivorus TaxID=297713 RepID=A0AAW0AR74_9AGAR
MEGFNPSAVPLFIDMPWFSPFVGYSADRSSLLPEDLWVSNANYFDLYDPQKYFAQRMAQNLLGDINKRCREDAYNDMAFNRCALVPTQKSAAPVVSHLFALRLLDVACSIHLQDRLMPEKVMEGVSTCLNRVVPRTAVVGETQKLRGLPAIADGRGWPNVIANVRDILKSNSVKPALLQASKVSAPREQGLASLSKIMQNVHAAAFCVNYALQGYSELPSTFDELYKGGSRIRQPLLLALAITPVLLLVDFAPMSTNITKLHILRAWFHYGTSRPPILLRLESSLWRKLFAVARGFTTPVRALQDFISEAESLLPLAVKEQGFFETGVGAIVDLPPGLSYERAIANNTRSDKENSVNRETNLIPSADSYSPSAISKGVDGLLASETVQEDNIRGGRPSHWMMSRVGISRRKDTTMIKESNVGGSNCVGPVDEYPEPASNSPKTVFTEVIRKPTRGQAYVVVGLDGRREVFWPTCSTSHGLSYLVGLLERSNLYQTTHGNSLLFYKLTLGLAGSDEEQQFARSDRGLSIRGVVAFTADEYDCLDAASMLPDLLRGHVLVAFSRQKSASGRTLNTKLLSEISATLKPRLARMDTRPYPITADADAVCTATFSNFLVLLSSPGPPRIMSFPLVPSAASSTGTVSISTNIFSRRYINHSVAGFAASASPSNGWYFVATANAVRKGMLSPDALNTELTVCEGSVIVFVGLPAEDPTFLAKTANLRVPPSELLAKIHAVSAVRVPERNR